MEIVYLSSEPWLILNTLQFPSSNECIQNQNPSHIILIQNKKQNF